ncbi:MAG: hypothetical protein BWY76_01283 [bacterium ADurb.Bin429]|nr:MAG: hypothetical protein BWY76_01283 [bacterium ADurb.Bin429]
MILSGVRRLKLNEAKTDAEEKVIFTLMPWIEDEEERMAMIHRALDALGIPRDDDAPDALGRANI